MERPADEDVRLLDVAESVADGTPVDWNGIRAELTDPETATVVEQLRLLHGIAAVHAEHDAWGSLTILDEIGRGSFARVYRAFDAELHRDVALKIIGGHQAAAPFDPARALEEARRLARVSHPNVVTIFGTQKRDDAIAVSMELVKGVTLDALIRRQGPLGAHEAARIGVDLCRAVAAVHEAGLIHGDIKAHNVMRDEAGRVVLMDFGAGHADGKPPRGGDFAGTPLYLPPEVFAGQPRTSASDIYSLGILLFYLVTGTYPVDGDTRTEVGLRHQQPGARRRLDDIRPDLPEPFVEAVEKALADVPHRYRTAEEFEAALSAALGSGALVQVVRKGRNAWLIAASVALTAALAGTAYFGLRPDTPVAAVPTAEATAATPAPAEGMYRIEAGMYRVDAGGPTRLDPATRLAPGDRIFLQLRTSIPAHAYVVNEDDRGEAYLLYPLPGQPAAALPPSQAHRLPGLQNGSEVYWQVSSAGGREHFLIFVSPERLTAFERIFAMLPSPTPDRPVSQLPPTALGLLRGVGGLSNAPPANELPRLSPQYTTPLPAGEEVARGLWVRQVAFDNP